MREGYQLETTDIENVSDILSINSANTFLDEKILIMRGYFSLDTLRYNKAEKDFPSLLEYNNYLEEVEDISELKMAVFGV